MRLLIIDPAGCALDLAMRAQACEHQVKWFITQNSKTEHIGRGFAEIVDDFHPWLLWADLVFMADNTKYMRDIDAARELGSRVFGPTRETAEWELDREKGQSVFRKAGIPVPPYRVFDDYDKAITYVKKEDRRFVSKPSGDADKSLSYVSKSPEDLVYMLERWKKAGKLKAPFILQEFIDGTEMAVGAWMGSEGNWSAWCENFEFKKLMDGDLGVSTGEQGTVLRYVSSSKLADRVLKPLAGELQRRGYCGYIDINCIIDEKGMAWPLEFTTRPGWPTFNIQAPLFEDDCVQWMKDLMDGRSTKGLSLNSVAAGIVLSIPDYPYSHITRKEVVGVPIYGLTPALSRHVQLCEAMMGKAPHRTSMGIVEKECPVTAGDYVLVMTAVADNVLDAKNQCLRRLTRLTVPNSPMWRTDIGDRLSKELPKLQAMGYARGLRFSNNAITPHGSKS